MIRSDALAPEIAVSQWFNTSEPLSLTTLRGRPILIHAFQMLCPGCVSHALPQTERVHRMFSKNGLQVIGLHTVFEHHDAMTPVALAAFIHEYRLSFPVGVDEAGDSRVPVTMERFGMRGTPTTLLIDRQGKLVSHQFGRMDDLALGASISFILGPIAHEFEREQEPDQLQCGDGACASG